MTTAPLPPSEFYDALAGAYDTMTSYSERVERGMKVLAPMVADFRIARAVDMGCGTGMYAHVLARLGVDTTGIDISDGMLAQARVHASAEAVSPRFLAGDFLSPEISLLEPLDAVFCLGNTLPHVASQEELACVLAHWRTALRADGVVIVQILNYTRILGQRERIIAARKEGDATIVRFYDFTEPRLTFNILTLDGTHGALAHTLRSTLLLPITADVLSEAALRSGFTEVALYGSLAREPLSLVSTDLVAVLRAAE